MISLIRWPIYEAQEPRSRRIDWNMSTMSWFTNHAKWTKVAGATSIMKNKFIESFWEQKLVSSSSQAKTMPHLSLCNLCWKTKLDLWYCFPLFFSFADPRSRADQLKAGSSWSQSIRDLPLRWWDMFVYMNIFGLKQNIYSLQLTAY